MLFLLSLTHPLSYEGALFLIVAFVVTIKIFASTIKIITFYNLNIICLIIVLRTVLNYPGDLYIIASLHQVVLASDREDSLQDVASS